MESEMLRVAASQGIWALLCVVLILYILKAQEKRDIKQENREKRYEDIIEKLTCKLDIIDIIKCDISEIKETIWQPYSKNKI